MSEITMSDSSNSINQTKLNRAAVCLYVLFGLRFVASLYALAALGGLSQLLRNDFFELSLSSTLLVSVVFNLGLGVFTVYVNQGLKEQKLWAWLSGISLCLLGIVSWGLPAAVLGILSLIDAEVRTPFIKQLDIKL